MERPFNDRLMPAFACLRRGIERSMLDRDAGGGRISEPGPSDQSKVTREHVTSVNVGHGYFFSVLLHSLRVLKSGL